MTDVRQALKDAGLGKAAADDKLVEWLEVHTQRYGEALTLLKEAPPHQSIGGVEGNRYWPWSKRRFDFLKRVGEIA